MSINTLTIIIPCYNEKNTIVKLLDKIEEVKNIDKEIIVVDDKSTDGSIEIIIIINLKACLKKYFTIKT